MRMLNIPPALKSSQLNEHHAHGDRIEFREVYQWAAKSLLINDLLILLDSLQRWRRGSPVWEGFTRPA
jgi:hypothetical protein